MNEQLDPTNQTTDEFNNVDHTSLSKSSENVEESLEGAEEVQQVLDEAVIEEVKPFPIAKVRKRIAAYLIDLVLLVFLLFIISIPIRFLLLNLGPYARLLTFFVMLIYFTNYYSEKKGGQTIGKRLLKIGVVDKDGQPIPANKAFWRALFFAGFLLFNQGGFPILATPIGSILATIIVFGLGLSFLYGMIFNRATKQTIHDLLVGTYVIDMPVVQALPPPTIPKIHKRLMFGIPAVVASLAIIMTLAGFGANGRLPTQTNSGNGLVHLQQELANPHLFHSVSIQQRTLRLFESGNSVTDLQIELWLRNDCRFEKPNCDELIDTVAHQTFESYNDIYAYDGLAVVLTRRLDLGILNTDTKQNIRLRISEWEERLKLNEIEAN